MKPLSNTRPKSNSHGTSTLTSQKSKHGFYSEFSVVQKDKNYGSKKIISSLKPGPDQTYKDKYKENVKSCFSKNCLFGLFPILLWLPHYRLSWLKPDIIAGITVSILLVPQALAYAQLAGLPAEWGLYASVMPVILYAIWSTSTKVAVGPGAPTAIMVASAVEGIMVKLGASSSDDGYDELYQSIAMTVSLVCGMVLIIFGLIRAGFIVVFLSRPVMTGFIMAAAFIILINQFRSLLGLDMDRYPLFYETLVNVLINLDTINWYTTLISAVALFILFLPKCCLKGKIPKWCPIPLIVIVLFILISHFADLESLGVAIVGGDIKSGFPTPKPPNFKYIGNVFPSAIVVAIVSYMGSIALAKGFEQKTKETYKQQLSKYNAWCRDNVAHLELDDDEHDHHQITPQQKSSNNGEIKLKIHQEPHTAPTTDDDDANDLKPSDELEELKMDTSTNNKNLYKRIPNKSMEITDSKILKKLDENKEESDDEEISKPPIKPLSLPAIDVDANMEFIAFGIANLLGSFFSSQVISASFSRSALNVEMNAHSQFSSFIRVIICVLCLLFLMSLLSPLPKCVLASVVTVSVYRLINNGINEFKFLLYVSRIELIEFLIAFISPLIIGLEIGIFLSIGTSVIVNLLRHSFASIIFLGRLQSTMSDDAEYVDCELFKKAKYIPHITIIEMKAELSFSNNNHLVDKLRRLLIGGNKYIVVSLNLTSFIDTTAIRQIVTIFEDAKGAYICLSQCRPKVMELVRRYQKDSDQEFPSNIKTFISTHDAVRFLQSIRSKQIHIDMDYISDDDDEEEEEDEKDEEEEEKDLSSLSKPSVVNHITPRINPVQFRSSGDSSTFVKLPWKKNNPSHEITRELSELDIAYNTARKHTFSMRGRTASQNKSISHNSSTHEQLESESDDHDDDDDDDDDEVKKEEDNKPKISRIQWSEIKSIDHVNASLSGSDFHDEHDKQSIDMYIVDNLTKKNIGKIDENSEVEINIDVDADGNTKQKEINNL